MGVALDHNIEALRTVAVEAEGSMPGRAAFGMGMLLGVALAQRAPKTAAEFRAEVERRLSSDLDETPEQTEVRLLDLVGLFDRRADQ